MPIPVLENKIKALGKFGSELEEETMQAAEKLESEINALVTVDQLFQGIDGEGRSIQPPYARATIAIKRKKLQPTDRVTLKDTGAFYRSIEILFGNTEFVVGAADRKTQKLVAKYGADILGLNADSQTKLSEKIKPLLIEELRKKVL